MNTNQTSQRPDDYIWDFWYLFEERANLFHVLYLNADRKLAPAGTHHAAARVGYARTKNFVDFEWIDNDVFHADPSGWDNTSIWTGDLIRTKRRSVLFYTSRDACLHDGHTQSIGMATSHDYLAWRRVADWRLDAAQPYYAERSISGDATIHAWRDPFVFRCRDRVYMLVAAKAADKKPNHAGAIGIARSLGEDLSHWELLPPIYAAGLQGELEVPQMYRTPDGQFRLVFSCWCKYDHVNAVGGLQSVPVSHDSDSDVWSARQDVPDVLLPESAGVYACRVIPELNGEIVGFSISKGGLMRSGVAVDWLNVNRDFSMLEAPS